MAAGLLAFGIGQGVVGAQQEMLDVEELEAEQPSLPEFAGERINLETCIARALGQRQGEWGYQVAALDSQAINPALRYIPFVQAEDLFGPLPEKNDFSNIGIVNFAKVTVGIPVFDFGRSASFYKAAFGRARVEDQFVRGNEMKEVVEVTQLYYGLLLAKESLAILYETQNKVKDYQEKLQARFDRKRREVSRADLLQLEVDLLKIEQKISQAENERDNAYQALALKIGFDRGKTFDIEERFLRPLPVRLKNLEEYQKLAVENRPEISALNIGMGAREAQVEAEKKALYPGLFLGGFFEYGKSTAREYDDNFNFTRGGAGVSVRWNFDFATTQSKVKSARSEYLKLVEQQRLALPAIELDVTRAYRQAARMKEEVERGKRARKLTRALLFFTKSNWDIGVGDPVKLKDALIRFNEARFDHLKSIFEFNVACAKLSQAVGEKFSPASFQKI